MANGNPPVFMTGNDYQEALDKLGLTHSKRIEQFLGVDYATSYRYANGRTRIPKPTAMLLRLMVRESYTLEEVDIAAVPI